jgi:hypothetical protein
MGTVGHEWRLPPCDRPAEADGTVAVVDIREVPKILLWIVIIAVVLVGFVTLVAMFVTL